MNLDMPISVLQGVGAKRESYFNSLGIRNIWDLLTYYPYRYEDLSHLKYVNDWIHNENVVLVGRIIATESITTRTYKQIVKATIASKQGDVVVVWFGQKYLLQQLKSHSWILCYGKAYLNHFQWELAVSKHIFLTDEVYARQYLRIEPIYPASAHLKSKIICQTIEHGLEFFKETQEWIDSDLSLKYNLMSWKAAIKSIHLPKSKQELEIAIRTLKILEMTLIILSAKSQNSLTSLGVSHKSENSRSLKYLENLPYVLTDAQRRSVDEIYEDLESSKQMHRLLQGDVGSGKTIIAILALLKIVDGNHQGVLMAPTEILIQQHYFKMLESLNKVDVKVALLTGSTKKKDRVTILDDLKTHRIDILFTTHAVLESDVIFSKLGLAIIDEQHRFGVHQRNCLEQKGRNPDVLVMTATPIPRSLALTVYGDLDLSIINELPPGRKPVATYWVGEHKRKDMYQFVHKELKKGHQVYVVCPLVKESEKLDLANATKVLEIMKNEVFIDYPVGMLHGKMSSLDKKEVMDKFANHKLSILVSTTVIEVGVDVSNATVMIIENAERFGLAQLHQLRGRVGRSNKDSYCMLMSDTKTEEGKKRLKTMVASNDGFAIAEADLEQRGPGEILGIKQHGLNFFKLSDPVRDQEYIPIAKEIANELYTRMDNEPELSNVLKLLKKNFSF